MIDHLMLFADTAAMLAEPAMAPHLVAQDDGSRILAPDHAMTVSVTVPDSSGTLDESGQPLRVSIPGAFAWVSLTTLDPTLRDLRGNACRLIADRDGSAAGKPMSDWLLYRAPALDDATMAVAEISPVFAGANYPFGQV